MTNIAGTRAKLFLKPGELTVTEVPTQVSTVLGSCVALTFFNRRLKYGAICHAMLPTSQGESDFKYVNEAFDYMLGRFALAGIERAEIEVKLFGGSEVLPRSTSGTSFAVGRQNIDMAKALIEKEGLRLYASHIGGPLGRKLHFYTHTGEILLKSLQKSY